MTYSAIPSHEEVLRAALEGVAARIDASSAGAPAQQTKVASTATQLSLSPDILDSMAAALEEMAEGLRKEAASESPAGPGKGPNASNAVPTPTGGGAPLKPGELGSAHKSPGGNSGTAKVPGAPQEAGNHVPTSSSKTAGALGAGLGAAVGGLGGAMAPVIAPGAMAGVGNAAMDAVMPNMNSILNGGQLPQAVIDQVHNGMYASADAPQAVGGVLSALGGAGVGAGIGHGIESLLRRSAGSAPAAAQIAEAAAPAAAQAAPEAAGGVSQLLKDPRILAALGLGGAGAAAGGAALAMGGGSEGEEDPAKTASLARRLVALQKQAADPAAPPPGSSDVHGGAKPPLEPGQEGKKNLVNTNASAQDFTKRDGKAPEARELAKHVTEPAMKDPVLGRVFDHTAEAGAKTASATTASTTHESITKQAAAMELLRRFNLSAKGAA